MSGNRETKTACILAGLVPLLLMGGCVQQVPGQPMPPPGPSVAVQCDTITLEHRDRIARFQRLAALQGTAPPLVDELDAPPGSVPGCNLAPVVRVVFTEGTFFASGSDVPLPRSGPILDLIAENMKRDVPDASLTLLGHTDAMGSDALNVDLSRRRAAAVMAGLIERGVPPSQLNTVAIGKAQPIASNLSAVGRARNRRVEFMISGSEAANLAVVTHRLVNRAYLQVAARRPAPAASIEVSVYKPDRAPSGPGDLAFLKPSATIALAAPRDIEPGSDSPGVPKDIEPGA